MKKHLKFLGLLRYSITLLIFLMIPIHGTSQITKLEVPQSNKIKETVIKPYDSLASLNSENYLSHIGQTLYLLDTKYAAEKKAYTQFFTQLTFKPDYNREIYKYAYKSNEPVDKFLRGSDYDFMKNKYFYVADVIIGPADKYYETGKMINLKLIETTTKDTIFYRADVLPSWKSKDFITVGYYEKLKKTMIGETYITQNEVAFNNVAEKGSKINFTKGIALKLIDITIYDSSDESNPVFGILEDKKTNQKVFVHLSSLNEGSSKTSFSYSIGGYRFVKYNYNPSLKSERVLKIDANDKETLIKKFGTANATIILSGEVKPGFSKDMCLEAWGKPKSINKTTVKQGVQEQWIYGNNSRYLYFTNGKLTAFQD